MWQGKKVGIAMGSGGARGWAHLGVLQALGELKIPVDYVAGTSMGALVGVFVAAGQLQQLRNVALNLDWMNSLSYFMEMSFSRSGLLKGHRFSKAIRNMISKHDFSDLDLPFAAVATDLESGEPVVLDRGDLLTAVRASISIPGIFAPVKHDGRMLADGGLVDPVPVDVVRRMGAEFIIAVDVTQGHWIAGSAPAPKPDGEPKPHKALISLPNWLGDDFRQDTYHFLEKIETVWLHMERRSKRWIQEHRPGAAPSMTDVLSRSARIAESQLARSRLQLEQPDIILSPAVGDIGILEFHRAKEAMTIGYVATMQTLGL